MPTPNGSRGANPDYDKAKQFLQDLYQELLKKSDAKALEKGKVIFAAVVLNAKNRYIRNVRAEVESNCDQCGAVWQPGWFGSAHIRGTLEKYHKDSGALFRKLRPEEFRELLGEALA
jgi:hypothetical protein